MLVVDSVLGNVDDDPALAARIEDRPSEAVERVVLDERDRRRGRLRTTTDAGTELGIVAPEDGLRPGDVLVADDERAVVVAFADRDALVVDFAGVEGSADALAGAAALGHRLGNRHRDLAVRDGEVLVALDAHAGQVRETVAEAAPPGTEVREAAVDPALFDGTEPHSRGDGHGHTHGGGSHDRGDGHDHHDHAGTSGGHDHGGVHTIDDPGEGSS